MDDRDISVDLSVQPCAFRPASGVRELEDFAALIVAFSIATVCWNGVIQLVSRLRACPEEHTLCYSLSSPCRLVN